MPRFLPRIQVIGLATAFLSGCASPLPRTSPGTVDEFTRHAERHQGQLIASGGPLLAVRRDGDGAVLRIATGNYGHLFDVALPRYSQTLTLGSEVSFVGRLTGVVASREAYDGQIILVQAVALKPIGAPPILVAGDESLANAWLKGDLDLMSAGTGPALPTPGAAPAPAPVASASPSVGETSQGIQEALDAYSRLSPQQRAEFLKRITPPSAPGH